LLAAGGASAQSMSSIDAREANQQERIDQGRRDGALTRSETNRLEQGEQHIDRNEARARADGVVSSSERQRLDNMLDRQGREIYQQSHDGQRADGRGRDGGGRDGWGQDRDGSNRGQHEGWNRGEHNGWDGNRPPGIERRDAREEQRIRNGVRDGSLTHGEAAQLQHGQNRIDRTEAHARTDGVVTPGERSRIQGMQNSESRQTYNDRHNSRTAPGTSATTPATPAAGTQSNGGSHNWGNGGWRTQQAANTAPATPRPTMTRVSSPSGGGRR